MGQVELCSAPRVGGFRTKVCDTNWDNRDAEVVCRELGLPSGEGAKSEPISVQWSNHVCVLPCSHLLQQMLQQQADVCLEKEE